MDVVEGYLRELRNTFTYLSNDRGVNVLTYYTVIPWIIVVFTTAISSNFIVPCMTIMISLFLLVLGFKYGTLRVYTIFKPLAMIVLIAFISSSPILLNIVPGSIVDVYLFILRATASTLIFISGVHVLGWLNIIKGMMVLGIPASILEYMLKTIKFIPLFMSETLRILIARTARILSVEGASTIRLRRMWCILASVIADLIVKTHYRALMFNLAFTARTLNPHMGIVVKLKSPLKLKLYDYVMFTCSTIVVLVEVLYRI